MRIFEWERFFRKTLIYGVKGEKLEKTPLFEGGLFPMYFFALFLSSISSIRRDTHFLFGTLFPKTLILPAITKKPKKWGKTAFSRGGGSGEFGNVFYAD